MNLIMGLTLYIFLKTNLVGEIKMSLFILSLFGLFAGVCITGGLLTLFAVLFDQDIRAELKPIEIHKGTIDGLMMIFTPFLILLFV